MITELLLLGGSVLTLLAAIGTVRFSDVFSRMHALNKATTVGLLLVLAGGLVALEHPNDRTFVALAVAVHLVTSPIGATLLARSTYFAEGIPHQIDDIDELAECIEAPHVAVDPGDAG